MALLALLVLAVPGARGQSRGGDGVSVYVGGGATLTRIHGDPAGAGRFMAGLQITPRLRVGGRGVLLGGSVDLGRVGFQEVDLDVGYGGVEATWVLVPGRRWSLQTSLLLGAGNADVRDAATGTTLDADNFFVLEAGLAVDRRLADPLAGFLSASWRRASGVEDLPGVSTSDLGGPSLSLGLRISTS